MPTYFTNISPGDPIAAATVNARWAGLDDQIVLMTDGDGFNDQAQNAVLAGPGSGGAGAVSFRALVAADIPSLPASIITSGSFDDNRIPNLDASKISSGTLDAARIPNLSATILTSDTVAVARLPVMVGADGVDPGIAGLVPAPGATDDTKYLRGDGTYDNPPGGGDLGPANELTIASGAITITGGNHTVDTEGDAASDDLETITGLADGEILFITAADASREVVIKHGSGNIRLNGGIDFALDNLEKGVLFIGTPSYVIGVGVPVSVGAGSGTVTSVGLTVPSVLSVSGSPVTTSGTLAVSFAGGQTANQVLASPDGSSGAVSLRALVADDIPALGASKITSGTFDDARIPNLDTAKITTGTFSDAQIPNLAASKITSGQLAIAQGGTGQSTANTAFNALAPTTTAGDLIRRGASVNERLGIGTNGDVLTVVSGAPAWAAPSGGANFATGTYTGNATDDRAITVGFQPKMVIIGRYGGGTQVGVFKIDPFGTETKLMSDGSLVNNAIKSFTGTGFVLGTYGPVNTNAVNFAWAAWG